MYRLLKLSGSSIGSCSPLSLRNICENTKIKAERSCLLCKNLYTYSRIFVRKSSSVTNPFLNGANRTNKRRKKFTKKYSDILVVSEGSSVLQKANIEKLTSSDLKLLADTDLNLSELYKLKDLSRTLSLKEEHTYNNLAVVENLPILSHSDSITEGPVIVTYNNSTAKKQDLADPQMQTTPNPQIQTIEDPQMQTTADPQVQASVDPLIPENFEEFTETSNELDLENIRKLDTLQPETLEEDCDISEPILRKTKLRHENSAENRLLQQHRDLISAKTLAAYVEICNHQKNPQRGLSAIRFHIGRSRQNRMYFKPLKNRYLFNSLLKGFALKGDLEKLKDVIQLMNEEQIQKDEHSYAAIFGCLGRIRKRDRSLKELRTYAEELHSKGFTFNQIMNKAKFSIDERDMVLRAMKMVDPNYEPDYYKPKTQYSNHLLDHLNHSSQLQLNIEKYYPNGGLFTPSNLNNAVRKQVKMEVEGYVQVKSIELKPNSADDVHFFRKSLNEHYQLWHEAAYKGFQRDLAAVAAKRSALNLEPYLRCIPTKDFVLIIVEEAKRIARGSETFSPTAKMLHTFLGCTVYAKYKILRKQQTGVLDKTMNIHEQYCDNYAATHGQMDHEPIEKTYVNPRQQWQLLENSLRHTGATLPMEHQYWVPTTLQAIGEFMYHIIMHDLQINVNCMRNGNKNKNYMPAFYSIFRTQNRVVKQEVKPHPILSKLYRASQPETLTFPTSEVPMLCPPVPWTSTQIGGYLVTHCDVIRLPSYGYVQKQRLAEADPVTMYPSLDALNQLGAVPWKVNEKILNVIMEVFTSGGSAKLDVPEHPSTLPPPPSMTTDMNKTERYQVFRQKLQYRRKKDEMYSLWCDCLYRLSLANHFRKDVFWLPHNMDFRGRVYPIPPHLNHLGSDLARSILVFAEPRPLGPDGFDWLKIHLVNLTGLKKRDSVEERLKFANEVMDRILDSADNPLTGKRWWADSDEPWQTLACCIEIADVIRSGDTVNYRSHFPVHQDGSCNGLQHYAALGRDSAGAYSVNLAPSELPQDVYSAVVQLVEEQRAKDAAAGNEIAKTLEGFVVRKVIKQTIMTTVYGVTKFGARLQIARQLKDIDSFPKEAVWAASSYLTGRTFDSLRTMFTSTKEIQDWFTECARLISLASGKHVEWVTPLGLPIVQPYFRYKKVTVSSGYDSFPIDKFGIPNVMKQKNAFPPNFIHSLDSCHMMLTSLHCERESLTFVSVHDCYWTHPSTVAIMNKICREQFVALHSEPILEDLSLFLTEKFSVDRSELTGDGSVMELTKKKLNRKLKQLPKKGKFDVRNVLHSIYFFS